jgi:hypothetical protein
LRKQVGRRPDLRHPRRQTAEIRQRLIDVEHGDVRRGLPERWLVHGACFTRSDITSFGTGAWSATARGARASAPGQRRDKFGDRRRVVLLKKVLSREGMHLLDTRGPAGRLAVRGERQRGILGTPHDLDGVVVTAD